MELASSRSRRSSKNDSSRVVICDSPRTQEKIGQEPLSGFDLEGEDEPSGVEPYTFGSGMSGRTGEKPGFLQSLRDINKTYTELSIIQASHRLFLDHVDAGDSFGFLSYLHIDYDGGLHKVKELWSTSKILWFLLLLAGSAMNSTAILATDVSILRQCRSSINLLSHFSSEETELSGDMVIFMFASRWMVKYFAFSAAAVAIFELALLLFHLVRMCVHAAAFLAYKNVDETAFYAWDAMVQFWQEDIQSLATFSALKALRYVHPSLILEGFSDWCNEDLALKGWTGKVASVGAFVLSRLLCFAFGIGALAVKTASIGLSITHPSSGIWWALVLLLSFANQIMGIIVMEVVLQRRLFLFIFGGADGELQLEERSLKHAYMAALMRRISLEFTGSCWTVFKGVVMMATFDHYDLQKLVLSENDEEKKKLTHQMSRGLGHT